MLTWGLAGQVEYLVVAFDDSHRKVRLSLAQADILKSLARDAALYKVGGDVSDMKDKQ
jgi:glutamate--cysteine ligase catalytic subunit